MGVGADTRDRARTLRRDGTAPEKRLWLRLRDRQILGRKFRRQHPIGPFFADFACIEARLVIELDGGQHAQRQDKDDRRTAFMEAAGWRVLRFWNHEVEDNLAGVVDAIARALP